MCWNANENLLKLEKSKPNFVRCLDTMGRKVMLVKFLAGNLNNKYLGFQLTANSWLGKRLDEWEQLVLDIFMWEVDTGIREVSLISMPFVVSWK